jgi:hypothetical protein
MTKETPPTKTPPKMFQTWTMKLMHGLLKPGLHPDRQQIRQKLVKYVDNRGLTLNDAATLHAYENTEKTKQLLDKLLEPRPGEKTNLEKIIGLLELLVRSNRDILANQVAAAERLDEIELQVIELRALLPNQTSPTGSTGF